MQMIWTNRNKIISATEQNGLRLMQFQKPERNGIEETLLKWLKQDRSENVLVSGPLLMITFVLPKFNFKLMYFLSKPVWKFTFIEE
jgi:hypothetical protein